LENEEVTIVFGDLSEKNGNLNNGLVAEDLAAALGVWNLQVLTEKKFQKRKMRVLWSSVWMSLSNS